VIVSDTTDDGSTAALNAALRGILDLVGSAVLFESASDWLDGASLHQERDKPAKKLRVSHGPPGSWSGKAPDARRAPELGRHVRALVEAGMSVGVPAAADALLSSPGVQYRRDAVSFPAGAAPAAGAAYVLYSRPRVPAWKAIAGDYENCEAPEEGAPEPAKR
jgi:hypothetical protein